jgi:hypothetical protein
MLHPVDSRHIVWLKVLLETASVADMMTGVLARPPDASIMAAITQFCTFDHCGVLVFPRVCDDVGEALRYHGFDVRESVPSVVVKDRLCDRYGVNPADIEVVIVRGEFATGAFGCRGIEVFAVSATANCPSFRDLVRAERTLANETHAALLVSRSRGDVLGDLCQRLSRSGYFVSDGCGYNPYHHATETGCSVLYFRCRDGRGMRSWPHRLEVICAGHHADVITAHADVSCMVEMAGVDGKRDLT